MREMEVALSNVEQMLDIMISIVEHDIAILTDYEKVNTTKTDVVIEKIFKDRIYLELVDIKKDVIHCIELEHSRNTKK